MIDGTADPRGGAVAKHRARTDDGLVAILRRAARSRPSHLAATASVLVVLAGAAITLAADGPVRIGETGYTGAGTGRPAAASRVVPPGGTDPGRVPATPAAMLELLTRLMRPVTITNPAKSSDGRLRVQTYLDDGQGPGMIRLGLRQSSPAAGDAAAPCRPGADPGRLCHTLPNGAQVTIVSAPDNCVQHTSVFVEHASGTSVGIDIASCLEFDGTTNPAGRLALTADQAVAIAADTRWGRTMDASLVQAGAERFPALREASLPDAGDLPSAPDPAPPAAATGAVERDNAVQWEDVNGDSADDYCRRVGPDNGRTGRVACTTSTGGGFGPTIVSPVLDWGPEAGRDWEDFNGDNRVDYCRRVGAADRATGRVACTVSTGTGFGATITSPPIDLGSDIGWAWDDADSDNKADYCRRLSPRNGATGRIACTLSTGTGFGRTVTSPEIDLGLDDGWEWEDVSGDDKSDYCRRLTPRNGATGRIACTLSTGTGFGRTITSPDLDLGADAGQDWEDVNGDDKADYCRRLTPRNGATGRIACTLSTGTGFGQSITSPELDLGADVGAAWEDANSDKRADYCRRVGRRPDASLVSCTLSTGSGFGATISSGTLDWGQAVGVRWVDLNADKKKDYCRRIGAANTVDSRLACTLSTGTGFGETVQSRVLDWGLDD